MPTATQLWLMKKDLHRNQVPFLFNAFTLTVMLMLSLLPLTARAAEPTLLFEDEFTGGIPGWTAVQPPGSYIDGPMLWQYDVTSDSFVEQSNIYTDNSASSPTRTAAMLINDTVAPDNFSYSARLTAGDNDGFGLIWGYQGQDTFYRVAFGQQARTGWPFTGWAVDRMDGGQITDLFGAGTPGYVQTFVFGTAVPFDVTIAVANNNLTLTVVDDPDGAHLVYNLVANEPLPSAAGGQVGMFTWGMQPAGGLRGFRIQNVALSPTALTGDPSSILSNWSFLITPRSDGTTNFNSGGPVLWTQALDANGDRGVMIENSDSYQTADNVAAGTTNFAAASAVAGDVDWTNYLYTARFRSGDNDGFGMLLRFKDENNFYRIAFRNQNSSSGVKRGISIQKAVDLVFDEIFASTAFIPPVNTFMDVYASIRDNRLQVMIVSNPTGAAPQGYAFGPFDITGGTVDNGKIGVFSWAQYNDNTQTTSDAGTEVDSVKVEHLDGEALLVASPFGTPEPPVGLNDLPLGGSVTATVDSLVSDAPGVRRVLVGWEGAGSVPATGDTNEVTFTLDSASLLNWKWRTEYELTTGAVGGGTVSASAGPWIEEGSDVTVTATANPGNMFVGWSGDNVSVVSDLNFAMLRPLSLTAHFDADSDGDGLPDNWEIAHFGNLDQGAEDDPDQDGASNLVELQRGSDPNFAEAVVVTDGLSSQWVNTQRDPALPGQLAVVDFGSGFRGAWDNSNDNRYGNDFTFIDAADYADYASFQSPRVIVKPELWNDEWNTNFTAEAEITVGDNDGNCFYFRYTDEQNWYRVTLCGEEPSGNTARPNFGITVQSRVNGVYSEVPGTWDSGFYLDPVDTLGYKRVRLTLTATGDNFELHVIGWNWLTGDFDPISEHTIFFFDSAHPTGRIGFGFWGQDGYLADSSTNGIALPFGAMIDNIRVAVDGSDVFTENWETAPMTNEFPAGWENPYAGGGAGSMEGNWQMSAHGTIMQLANSGTSTTGTADQPKADGEGPILLAPAPGVTNYLLEIGFQPFDDDGIGFVYNYLDTNNFSRVLFRTQMTFAGNVPGGLSISRKTDGVWTDIVAGDAAFLYTPGRPFAIEFANNNGEYHLVARDLDDPAQMAQWHWTDVAATTANRFGLACWAMQDAHFLYARASSLPNTVPVEELEITGIRLEGGNVILDITKPAGSTYDVLRATDIGGPFVPVATGLSDPQYTESIPAGNANFYRLQLVP